MLFKSSILDIDINEIKKFDNFAKDNKVLSFVTISNANGYLTGPLSELVSALITYHGSIQEAKAKHTHLFEQYVISLKPLDLIPHHLEDAEFEFNGEGEFHFAVINNFYNLHQKYIEIDHPLNKITVNLTITKGKIQLIEFIEPKENILDVDLVQDIKRELFKFRHISDYFKNNYA